MKSTFLMAVGLLFSVNILAEDKRDAHLSCLLVPSQQIEISSPVPGVVSTINFEKGDKVSKGQKLLSLESAVQEAVYHTAKAKAEFAERIIHRNQNLIDKNLLSVHEVDELITEKQLAELGMNEAKAVMTQRTVYSPISGFVVERGVSVGEYVGSDSVAKLVSLDPLHVKIVMSDDYGMLKRGMEVSIQPKGSTKTFVGKIDIVDRVIDAASGTFGVRAVLPNPGFVLPAGLNCQAVFLSKNSSKSSP